MKYLLLAVLLSLPVLAGPAVADPVKPWPGSRIRVAMSAGDEWHYAKISSIAGDTLMIMPEDGSPLRILPMRETRVVDAYLGRSVKPSRVFGGLLLGTLTGMLVGAFAGGSNEHCSGQELCGFGPIVGAAYGMAIGAPLGAAAGFVPTDTWRRVYASWDARDEHERLRPWP
jgi:hypothetical protein